MKQLSSQKQQTDLEKRIQESVALIRSKTKAKPDVAVILGSGLGDFAESLTNKTIIPTETIPHYPISTVVGHKGRLVFGKIKNVNLLAFQGRVHYYETGDLNTILYPIRVAHALGIKTLIVTNAAGGINRQFKPGDLMVIVDHLNLTFEYPLADTNQSQAVKHGTFYDPDLQRILLEVAEQLKIPLQRGVYCCLKGPSYETKTEVEMIRRFGGDAVGMSTINEITLARSFGMKILGISCITNFAAGIINQKLSHAEVTEVANMVKTTFSKLLTETILRLGKTK